ncbi:uncharacterized protein LOC132620252 [Lycium barbarum]|uniref:uncharacterized protein LOC132620252 n=1 Tax=Lycium barbarum TaxID=112863 RepID=UPI00293F2B62|nr:uncharacterized protein LOC132620252 [Lycium barbarum]
MDTQQPIVIDKRFIRQVYLQLLEPTLRVPWKCLMFKTDARSKAVVTMWLHLQGRLLTNDRLMKWGFQVDAECVFCHAPLETNDHLFVYCLFAKSLWDRLLRWLQRQSYYATSWEQHLEWVIKQAKGRSQAASIFKLVYAEVIHAIWIERNQRIF